MAKQRANAYEDIAGGPGGGAGGGPGGGGGGLRTSPDRGKRGGGNGGTNRFAKSQEAGESDYQAMGGSSFQGGSGSGGEGEGNKPMDGFADMMENRLGQDKKKKNKKKGSMKFGGKKKGKRSPASNSSLLGKNQNLFKRVSQRYGKKAKNGDIGL